MSKCNILDKVGIRNLKWFARLCVDAGVPEKTASEICNVAENTIRGIAGTIPFTSRLHLKWYESLRQDGVPDYSVYSDPEYLAEAYACWSVYSRNYLREIQKPQSMSPSGVLAAIRGHGAVVDVGNGIGFSTAGLKQLMPEATVYGTNFRDSLQWKVAEIMQSAFGFEMTDDISEIEQPVGLVFASEYFEHFPEPVKHLEELAGQLNPRAFLIANAFSADATGHFDEYRHGARSLGKKSAGKAFNTRLRDLGYSKVETRLWNNRPSLWIRSADLDIVDDC